MRNELTENARKVLEAAAEQAQKLGHPYIGTEHLLLGLLSVPDTFAFRILSESGVDFDRVRDVVTESIGSGGESERVVRDYTPRTKRTIENASAIAAQCGTNAVGTEHILFALLNDADSYASQILVSLGTDPVMIQQQLIEEFHDGRSERVNTGEENDYRPGEASSRQGGALEKYGRDLCQMVREGKMDPIIGRDAETERVIQILSRRTKNNPCLIGEPGVGKTAVVEGLAERIVNGKVPDMLRNKRIITLDLSGMIAGAKYRGEFEERLKKVMQEATENKDIILFIDEFHIVVGAGAAEGAVDAANIIKPALARGEMQMIGATTIDEYRKHIEKDEAFARRFQPVTVGEPTQEESVAILQGLRDKYESHHKVRIPDETIEAAVKLSARYISDRYLPDKAIDLIDEASSKIRIARYRPSPEMEELEKSLKKTLADKEEAIRSERYEEAARLRDEEAKKRESLNRARQEREKDASLVSVTPDDVAEIVTELTHIPVKKLAEEEGEKLLHLEDALKKRVIGQDEAVSAVARAIRRGRSGLKDPKRPTGSFIFLGPTGVGKTELSKALAAEMFGDENAMIRVDMSEYMEKHSVSKLIGSPPGYVGYDEGGQLTEKVRRHPYSVILLDEIEKAHPDVFNLLLQILEDGRLTDSQGRLVDFKNTVIIMTSNCGARRFGDMNPVGFTAERGGEKVSEKDEMLRALKETFRPEFLNRVDEIIVFRKLDDENIRQICRLMLSDVTRRLAENGSEVSFSDEVVAFLAKEGFDDIYGARPLRRAIVRLVEDPLSEAMLSGKVSKGDKIRAVLREEKIEFENGEDAEKTEK
ncbi:MAG: ATP-dependent Clp protease ATP-binding subunit [Clostridia bacterium]|nr:ATP-dependent Clp protease ATP-binding subunit [Clostridia bacterium]